MSTLTAEQWNERRSEGWLPPESAAELTYSRDRAEDELQQSRRELNREIDTTHRLLNEAAVTAQLVDALRAWQQLFRDRHAGRAGEGWYDREANAGERVFAILDTLGTDPPVPRLTPGGRYRLVGPDGVWVVTGLSTAGDTAELHLRREPQPPCPECGPGYRCDDEGCRHG